LIILYCDVASQHKLIVTFGILFLLFTFEITSHNSVAAGHYLVS